ncbi:MAG: chromosome segregation protein SMC, partial [Cyanobacteria bacterium P01_A01_bin.80]
MVHVKRVELTNFKSFGGTTSVPLLGGFTVVSGPNGSGKSNILDSLLFCLGLSSSKGMRADRLPDLVNNAQTKKNSRSTIEASVTVTFDLSDYEQDEDEIAIKSNVEVEDISGEEVEDAEEAEEAEEKKETEEEKTRKQKITPKPGEDWSVTRRLRVTAQGTYSSSYWINGISSNQTELHGELERLRVNPEGYNVVLQGDVTSIISMKARERREIIDELAGVAAFDRKINKAKDTLEEVREKEDSCRIIETELTAQCERLAQDKAKAEKYQKLRAEFLEKQKWESVLSWRSLQRQQEGLSQKIQEGEKRNIELSAQVNSVNQEIADKNQELEQLTAHLNALGGEQLLQTQSNLANQEAEHKQVQRQQNELQTALEETRKRIGETQQEISQQQHSLTELAQQHLTRSQSIISLEQERDAARIELEKSREAAADIASASEAWVQQQTNYNRQIETLLQSIEPQRTEQAQLRERNNQLQQQIQEQTELVESLEPQLIIKQTQLTELEADASSSVEPIQDIAQTLSATEQELEIQQQTQKRLLQEQRDKQRLLDKLEAQAQAQQEAQGTHASKIILKSGLSGVCGLVAQLGRVEPEYQIALEIAAGGRLGHIVVDDDAVGAAGIRLLKERRAGRATFLPLNKIRAPRIQSADKLRYANGFIDLAVNLIDCDRRYDDVFAYVFGSTVVFSTLNQARNYLGQFRIVTLEGELLESSGAMTGGSNTQRSALRFGTVDTSIESDETRALKRRLEEIDQVLIRCNQAIAQLSEKIKELSEQLTEVRQGKREQQFHLEQLRKDVQSLNSRLETARTQLTQNTERVNTSNTKLQTLEKELPAKEQELQQLRSYLAELESSQTPNEWQQIQTVIKTQEKLVQQKESTLREAQNQLKNLENQQQRFQEKIQENQQRIAEYTKTQTTQQERLEQLRKQDTELTSKIADTRHILNELEKNLGEEKQKRDRAEQELRSLLLRQQQVEWELQKLQESQHSRREALTEIEAQLQIITPELPNPIPEVPEQVDL